MKLTVSFNNRSFENFECRTMATILFTARERESVCVCESESVNFVDSQRFNNARRERERDLEM
jgi:hypothetical protein